jgi:hypothetical protein
MAETKVIENYYGFDLPIQQINAIEEVVKYLVSDIGTVGATTWGNLAGDIATQTDLTALLDQKQAANDRLTSIVNLADAENGILEKTGANSWAMRAFDGAADASLMTRLLSDSRYVRILEELPTGGADGQFVFRVDGAYNVTIYKRVGGTWTKWNPAVYAWASRPAATAELAGHRIYITEYKCDFECVTYNSGSTYEWRPVGGVLVVNCVGLRPTAVAAGGTTSTHMPIFSDTLPAGLLVIGCQLYWEVIFTYVGELNHKWSMINGPGSISVVNLQTAAVANSSASIRATSWVEADGSNGMVYLTNSVSASGTINGTETVPLETASDVIGAASTWTVGWSGTTGDTGTAVYKFMITFPTPSA